jgi:anti-sigma factor RsiW
MLKCRYTRARIPAFINQELPINARRYVARHLDECPACRAQFEHQKTLRHTLMAEVPRLGQPTAGTLENVWSRIAADLKEPAPAPTHLPVLRTVGYGFAAAMVGLALLLPLGSHFSPAQELPRPVRSLPIVRTDSTTQAVQTASAQATQIAFVMDYERSIEEFNTPDLPAPATPEATVSQGTPQPHIQKS